MLDRVLNKLKRNYFWLKISKKSDIKSLLSTLGTLKIIRSMHLCSINILVNQRIRTKEIPTSKNCFVNILILYRKLGQVYIIYSLLHYIRL